MYVHTKIDLDYMEFLNIGHRNCGDFSSSNGAKNEIRKMSKFQIDCLTSFLKRKFTNPYKSYIYSVYLIIILPIF